MVEVRSGEVRQVTTHPKLNADLIREAARDRWRTEILPALGITVRSDKRHGPCPHCGGKDRFRFDDKDGRGSFFCNQCRPRSGDGFVLIQKVRACTFPEALRLVAGILGIDAHKRMNRTLLPPLPQPQRCDWVKTASRLTLHALDLSLRAEKVLGAARGLSVTEWNEEDFDEALNIIGAAYRDLERSELLESVAFGLRGRKLDEERTRNASGRSAA